MRYLTGLCLLMAVVLLACSKSSDDTSTVGNWVHRVDFKGVARQEAVSFTIVDTAFVGTGADINNDTLRDFYSYDADKNTWTQRASLPDYAPARYSGVAFAVSGKGYIGAGTDGVNKLKDFYSYNPNGNYWEPIATFPGTARIGAVAFAVKTNGYVATGYDGNWLNDCYQYNPTENQWHGRSDVPLSKRADAVSFVIDNKAYIVTGQSNLQLNNELSMYDADNDVWTLKRAITNVSDDSYDDEYTNITGSNAVAFVMNNKAYVCTGNRGGSVSTIAWEYDPVNDLWDLKQAFEGTARTSAVGFAIKNRGFITTGVSGSTPLSDTWEFQPTIEYNKND